MKTLLVKITSTLIVASSLLATANTANAWGVSVNVTSKITDLM